MNGALRNISRRTPCALAALALAASLAGCAGSPHAGAPSGGAPGGGAWSFESDPPGAAPAGFRFGRTGGGRPGTWVVRDAEGAPDGLHVLVQTDTDDTDSRFPIAVAEEPQLADLRLTVRGRPLSGVLDQVVGVVFRYRDEDNYYLARTNIIEGNIRLYHVTKGQRQQIGNWKGAVAADVWQTLQVEAHGDHLTVSYDGRVVIDMHDATITGPGRVGVWTKSDSLTEFDQLVVEPLAP
jgi:hypothetical protein